MASLSLLECFDSLAVRFFLVVAVDVLLSLIVIANAISVRCDSREGVRNETCFPGRRSIFDASQVECIWLLVRHEGFLEVAAPFGIESSQEKSEYQTDASSVVSNNPPSQPNP